jgi:hypothetical protein
MTTLQLGQQRSRQFSQHRRRYGGQFSLLLIAFAVIAFGAFGYVGYVLWPRWPAPRLDAPALPITVAGVAFNLPPAAIRRTAQRRAGAHERIDLVSVAFARAARSRREAVHRAAEYCPGTVTHACTRVHDRRRRR